VPLDVAEFQFRCNARETRTFSEQRSKVLSIFRWIALIAAIVLIVALAGMIVSSQQPLKIGHQDNAETIDDFRRDLFAYLLDAYVRDQKLDWIFAVTEPAIASLAVSITETALLPPSAT
jgi:hypothetical protein